MCLVSSPLVLLQAALAAISITLLGSYIMYTHMMKQRRKLGAKQTLEKQRRVGTLDGLARKDE